MMPSAKDPAYAAAKAALINLTTSQAVALAPQKIRVNGIAPGSIDFPGGFWDRCRLETPEIYQSGDRRHPLRPLRQTGRDRQCRPCFLASPLASWITGQTLVVDGGQIFRGRDLGRDRIAHMMASRL